VEVPGIILWSDNFGRRTVASGTLDGIIHLPTLPLMVAGVAVQARARHVGVYARSKSRRPEECRLATKVFRNVGL